MKATGTYPGLFLVLVLCLCTGCGKNAEYAEAATDIADQFPLNAEAVAENPQLAESSGPYAVLHTTAGDITILLYPEQAPKAVENFIALAREGYYDGTRFHYVKKDEIAQTGRPEGRGEDGTNADSGGASENGSEDGIEADSKAGDGPPERSIWGEPFEAEFHDGLHNVYGAVGMAGEDGNLSQFYLVVKSETAEDERIIPANLYMNELIWERMAELNMRGGEKTLTEEEIKAFEVKLNEEIQAIGRDGVPEAYAKRYEEAVRRYQIHGGAWNLDYKYTVFGQIVEGGNVAAAITQVKVEAATRRPKKDVVIESIEIRE